jgi:hypothetical protein
MRAFTYATLLILFLFGCFRIMTFQPNVGYITIDRIVPLPVALVEQSPAATNSRLSSIKTGNLMPSAYQLVPTSTAILTPGATLSTSVTLTTTVTLPLGCISGTVSPDVRAYTANGSAA